MLRKGGGLSLQQEGQMLEVKLLGLEAASAFLKAMSGCVKCMFVAVVALSRLTAPFLSMKLISTSNWWW